jgi:hypothetical protein
MGVLKRKQESEAITFKLPAALKREIEQLRSRAEDAGFDLGETITAAMWRLCKTDQGRARRCPPSGPETEWPHNRTFDGETAVRIFRNFSAALRRAEIRNSEDALERGKGRSFVEQDKGPAVRCGIFGGLLNELAAFPPRRQS